MTRTTRVLCCLFSVLALSLCAAPISAQDIDEDIQKLADRIDELIEKQWRENDVASASPSDDAEYLRRVWLDLAGKIPTAADTQDFLDDKSPD